MQLTMGGINRNKLPKRINGSKCVECGPEDILSRQSTSCSNKQSLLTTPPA
jgi:hypothetical protein